MTLYILASIWLICAITSVVCISKASVVGYTNSIKKSLQSISIAIAVILLSPAVLLSFGITWIAYKFKLIKKYPDRRESIFIIVDCSLLLLAIVYFILN